MNNEEKIKNIRERARKNYSKGYNCSECIFESVINITEIEMPREIQKIATGFGGGIGLFGDTCGAVTGAVLSVSLFHGRDKLPEGERKEALKKAVDQLYGLPGLYRLFNIIPNKVKEKYGSALCRELAAEWRNNWNCRERALHCREIVTDCAELAASLIYGNKDELMRTEFKENVENLNDDNKGCGGKG